VMLTDTANFRNPHYHRSTDTVDTLNVNFMASVADGVTAAVRILNDAPEGL
jgi:aminopeptidase YwaD